jgi:dolichol-phosphate mannosyltransferase
MKKRSICIILPALNEELAVGKVIDEVPRQAIEEKGYQVDILVVDGNSSDRTRQIAQEKGTRVIVEPRRGKGRAVRTALSETDADFIFMLDADYTYPTTYIPEMLKILENFPVVVGSRLKGEREPGSMKRLNLIGNYLLTWWANFLYRTRISDLCTGYWGFRGEVIPNVSLTIEGFQLEAELLTQFARKGYAIAEIPIHYRRREGKAKLSGLKDGFKIGWMLLHRRFRA